MTIQQAGLEEKSQQSTSHKGLAINRNKLGTIIVGLLIAVALLVIVSERGETSLRNAAGAETAKAALAAAPIMSDAREEAEAASIARWEGMGQHYVALANAARDLGATADQARWEAIGAHLASATAVRPASAVAADQARWEAIGVHFPSATSARPASAVAADQARWEAMAEKFASSASLRSDNAVAADQARWDAMGAFYQLHGRLAVSGSEPVIVDVR